MLFFALVALLVSSDPAPAASAAAPGHCTKASATLYRLDEDASRSLKERDGGAVASWIRSAPHFHHGAVRGVKLLEIAPGSFGDSCGLRTNDVVLKVNGTAMKTIEDMVDAPALVRAKGFAEVLIQRGGRRLTLKISP